MTARPSWLPSVTVDLNLRCSDHDSTTYCGVEDVTGASVQPGQVVHAVERESGAHTFAVVKHIDVSRGLVYLNAAFATARDEEL